MKNFILSAAFIASSIFASANTDTLSINTIGDPVKKKKQINTKETNPEYPKKGHSFSYCNPYKISTFCNLIQRGNLKAVQKMICEGEDVNKVSNKLTPLMYAARHNRVDIVQLLIENGAKVNTRAYKGYTALKWAKLVNASESIDVISNSLKKQRK